MTQAKKAIIFDMDGVVMDSETHWDKQEFAFFKKLAPSWTQEAHKQVVGRNVHDTYGILKKNGLTMSEAEFDPQIHELAMGIYRNKATVMPGFENLAQALQKKKVPIGLASSSRVEWIEYALKKWDIGHYFKTITSSQEVNGPGKPAPDIYLLAAQKMGFEPGQCVAIEDSANGVKSAKAAGLFTIGFRFGGNDDQDHSSADWDVRGFTETNNQKILGLF